MSAWSEQEQRALVAAYNAMMRASSTGKPFNKAAINRYLRNDSNNTKQELANHLQASQIGLATVSPPVSYCGALRDRSRGSVELKLMNISGARAHLGLPILPGYKAAPNYQKSLETYIKEAI